VIPVESAGDMKYELEVRAFDDATHTIEPCPQKAIVDISALLLTTYIHH
jgi:hypothetical protein